MFTDSDTLLPKNTSRNLSYHHIASKTYFDVDRYISHHWFMIGITDNSERLEKMYGYLKSLKQAMIDIPKIGLTNATIGSVIHHPDILAVEIMVVCTNDCYNIIREKFSNGFNIQIMSKDRKPVSLIIF